MHDKYTSAGNTYMTNIHQRVILIHFVWIKLRLNLRFYSNVSSTRPSLSVLFRQASYKDDISEIVLPITGAFEMLLKLELNTHDIQCIYIDRYISGEKACYM
jgi:hypothetical protein